MSFLDNIKANKPTEALNETVEKKINPFITKPNPLLKKADASTETGEKKKLILPFAKKEVVADEPVAEVEPVEETKVTKTMTPKKVALKEEIVEKEEVKAEETKAPEEVKVEETKAPEEVKVEETKAPEEVKVEETKAPEEVKVEEVKIEEAKTLVEEIKAEDEAVKETVKSAPKTKRKSKPAKKESVSENRPGVFTTTMSYAEALESIRSPFVDENWEAFREEIEEQLFDIVISDDMNPSTLKVVLADLSRLRQSIWSQLQDTKTFYDQLSSKEPEGLIERTKRTAFGEDQKNDMERKKIGIESCMNYLTPEDGVINLYEVLDETRARYNFLRATMDSVQFKSNILITMNGALKLEKDHMSVEV
jgi:hypothetical protein